MCFVPAFRSQSFSSTVDEASQTTVGVDVSSSQSSAKYSPSETDAGADATVAMATSSDAILIQRLTAASVADISTTAADFTTGLSLLCFIKTHS